MKYNNILYIHSTKHNNIVAYIIKSVVLCYPICFNKICNSPWHWIVKFFPDVRFYTIPCFIYWPLHLFCFIWHLVTNLFIIFKSFSMVFLSRQFPSHSITGIPLHSWNALVLLELWHGVISFWCNTTHSHNISISWIISLQYFELSM